MPFFIKSVQSQSKQCKRKGFRTAAHSRPIKDVSPDSEFDNRLQTDNESLCSTDEEEKQPKQRYETNSDSSPERDETTQDKRLRLAKDYLDRMKRGGRDEAIFDKDVTRFLEEDYLEGRGKFRRNVASHYIGHGEISRLLCRDHKRSVTCTCLTNDGQYLFSGSKDGSIVKWSVPNRSKVISIKGGRGNEYGLKCIMCIAVSLNSKYLVIGCDGSKSIKVFSASDLKLLSELQGHKDVVTGLIFRRDSHTLYSASLDRSVRVWDMDNMTYVESFFGHQSGITSIDVSSQEKALTSGGFDGTIRMWKISEESQLIFNGHCGSVDIVKFIDDEHFLSCGDDGQLCVWSYLKKKPLCCVQEAHGRDEGNNLPTWISSVTASWNTDLVASGSRNGSIKVWKCGGSFENLDELFEIKLDGFINSLTFSPDARYLFAGIGQEHKLGRWWRIPQAKIGIAIIPLTKTKDCT